APLAIVCSLAAGLLAVPAFGQDPERPPSDPSAGTDRQAPEPQRERQQPDDADDAVIVTATRAATAQFDSPFSTAVVTAERFRLRAYRTLPQALRDVPGVMVQETSVSQGSPYIRGFTGYHNLLLVDGIRLNHSAFRSGPNQYWSTVDPMSLDRLEIVKGSS